MSKILRNSVIVAGVAAGTVLLIVVFRDKLIPTRPLSEDSAVHPVGASAQPQPSAPRYPVPVEISPARGSTSLQVSQGLPRLDESDASLKEALGPIASIKELEGIINLEGMVRRFVIAVDNAVQSKPGPNALPLFLPTPGKFLVHRRGDQITENAKSFSRYGVYMAALKAVDVTRLVRLYVHYYPLFQAAYRDLTPDGYFNDRLIEAMDSALGAPEPTSPPQLLLKTVAYKYADPRLEACTSVQKLMIRIGPINETLTKQRLREIKSQLTQFSKQ